MLISPLLATALLACNGGQLPTGTGGDYALAFDGDGCAQVPVDAAARGDALTIEAEVRGAVDASPVGHKPVVVWQSVFALVETSDERTWFGEDDIEEGDGVFDVQGILDGKGHHLAGTWDADGKMRLFVDGELIGFQTVTPGSTLGDTIEIGCWGEDGFEGTIDEVRLSSVVRYEEAFEPSDEPHEVDADTTALWHMDEGAGDELVDATGSYNGNVFDVTWVESGGSEE
ncbi:MAG: LamG domain-containing protein [Proteobacteria bacterium]|nr:LamG domain-containing protein [Pseudomonadota bacterium]MCP4920328.1 LamG domain-containing protein [Pseudomonadota bacterium]